MISKKDVQEYHFAGTGVHPPISVTASSVEEAEAIKNQKLGIVIIKSEYKEEKETELD